MITPNQALENLVQIAERSLLNGPDRRAINESIDVLRKLVAKSAAAKFPETP